MMSVILTIIPLICQYGFLSNVPSITDTIIVKTWQYCGPFSIGAREGIMGVDEQIELNPEFLPDTTRRYPSILTPAGYVGWTELAVDGRTVQLQYPDVLWDTLLDYYGVTGILSGAYVYGEFECEGVRRGGICAQGISSFKLNGEPFLGDVYKDGYIAVPVMLDSGMNRVLIKVSGFTTHTFDFAAIPVDLPIKIISRDITMPDLSEQDQDSLHLGIPVMNTTDQRVDDCELQVKGQYINTVTRRIDRLMPFSALKIPVTVCVDALEPFIAESVHVQIRVLYASGKVIDDASIYLHVKDRTTGQKRTFISNIDHSCQYYAILPPKNFDPESTYACIMTCHGAGVKAENQINAYSQKTWAFVCAPTNRRRYGFDWQDWGRIDFLEVLQDMKKHYHIDEDRVYLTGHSMGGHGVWHIGTRHPDLFAALAPSAGWTAFQLYIPWFLQKSEMYAHPDLLRLRDIVLRDDNPLVLLENLHDVPVYILHGGADDNVPSIQGRMFAKALDQLGYDYIYNEIADKRHWWDIDSTPGTDCVDLEEMMEFLKKHTRTSSGKKKDIKEKITIKHAYFTPFKLVYGTIGDSISTRNNLNKACMQSYVWWYRANGYAEILPDTEVTRDIIKNHNLIVFGNAETNAVLKWTNHELPIKIEHNRVLIDTDTLFDKDLCIIEIYPNPLNPDKFMLVYAPASREAEKLMGFFTPLYAGAGLPDYMVYNHSVLTHGWAGIIAAGFFDTDWKIDAQQCYLKKIGK
jgi:predicted esterase